MSTASVILLGCLGVLVFDALAALLSRTTSLRYVWFAPGSFVIYAVTGYFAADAAGSVAVGAAAGALTAAVDATLGSLIGKGLQGEFESVAPRVEAAGAAFAIIVGALAGVAAGYLAAG